MMTRAIVEEVLTPFEVRVRIPSLDRVKGDSLCTRTEDLNIATICTLPNCYLNVQVGDIVFIVFEDNTERKAVIIGHLSRELMSNTLSDLHVGDLIIDGILQTSKNSRIGDISYSEMQHLSGIDTNIAQELKRLTTQIENIQQILNIETKAVT